MIAIGIKEKIFDVKFVVDSNMLAYAVDFFLALAFIICACFGVIIRRMVAPIKRFAHLGAWHHVFIGVFIGLIIYSVFVYHYGYINGKMTALVVIFELIGGFCFHDVISTAESWFVRRLKNIGGKDSEKKEIGGEQKNV